VHFEGAYCLHLQDRYAACIIRYRRKVPRPLQKFSPKSFYKAIDYYLVVFLFLLTPRMRMELTECSETSAHKIQTPGTIKKEYNIQNTAFFLTQD
jgi:hypothetical protein